MASALTCSAAGDSSFWNAAHLVFADPASPSAEQAHMAELERLVGQLTFELAAAKKLSRLLNSP